MPPEVPDAIICHHTCLFNLLLFCFSTVVLRFGIKALHAKPCHIQAQNYIKSFVHLFSPWLKQNNLYLEIIFNLEKSYNNSLKKIITRPCLCLTNYLNIWNQLRHGLYSYFPYTNLYHLRISCPNHNYLSLGTLMCISWGKLYKHKGYQPQKI